MHTAHRDLQILPDTSEYTMLLSFLLSRLLLRLPLMFQLFKQTAIVDGPDSVLVKKPFLIFAEGVEHLPLCETTKPAVFFPKHTQLKDGAYTLLACHIYTVLAV